MKTKKSKRSKNGTKIKSSGSKPGLVLMANGDYREEDFEFWPRPTEWQLAQLAAQLARAGKVDAKKLIHDAWEIYWEGCRKIQNDHRDQKACFEQESATDASLDDSMLQPQPAVPQPKKYPITFREAGILLLPEMYGQPRKRAKRFREYIFDQLARQKDAAQGIQNDILPINVPTQEEVDEEYTARIPRFKANPTAKRGGGPVFYSVAAVEKFLQMRTLPCRLPAATLPSRNPLNPTSNPSLN